MRRLFFAIALSSVIVLGGCTDQLLDSGADAQSQAEVDKFRHAHLLDAAVHTEMGKSGDSSSVGLVIGFSIEPYKFFQRYKLFQRYKFFQRYEYNDVFYGIAGEIDQSELAQLQDDLNANPDVTWYEPDIFVPQEDFVRSLMAGEAQGTPWGIERVGATRSSAISGDGSGRVEGVEVYVLDTGVEPLDLNVTESGNYTTSDPADFDGHGTHIAGTMAAEDDDDWVVGVAPGANVRSLKVLDRGGTSTMADIVAAVEKLVGFKIEHPSSPVVANLSFGADVGTTAYTALDVAVQAAVNSGIVVVAAAGNDGMDASTVTPAHTAEVITVGAYDVYDRFAPFSNYGSAIDILAPGVDILSVVPDPDGGVALAQMSGTSMAAAHVSGAAALFLSQNPSASPGQVRNALLGTANASVSGTPSNTTNKSVYVGRLDNVTVPPFFRYAVATDGELKFENGDIRIGVAPDAPQYVNANVHSNKRITVRSSDVRVSGFGYFAGDIDDRGGANTWRPNYNPTGAAATQKVERIDIPEFDAESHAHLQTRYSNDLKLSGHYTLGTRSNPEIWYVHGNVKIEGPTTLSGYGVFIVRGNVEIEDQLRTESDNGETTVAFYSQGNIAVRSSGASISAQLLSRGGIELANDATLYGNVTTTGHLVFKGDAAIGYRETSCVLTEPIWPVGNCYAE